MKLEKTLLSVVVPTTKVENKIQYLTSWLLETCALPMEVIIVHDVSDSESSKILSTLLAEVNNPRIRLIEGRFQGPGNSRNEGLQQAHGEWITFWDSDDSPSPKVVIDMLLNYKNCKPVICANYEIRDLRKKRIVHKKLPSNDLELVIQGGVWRYFFKRNFATKARFGQFKMGEDYLYLARLSLDETNLMSENVLTYQYITGHEYQLTNNPSAISDLSNTVKEFENENLHKTGNRIAFLIFVRLHFSLLLNSKAEKKIKHAAKILFVIFGNNRISKFQRVLMVFNLAKGLINARN